jgi:hypothetical protein
MAAHTSPRTCCSATVKVVEELTPARDHLAPRRCETISKCGLGRTQRGPSRKRRWSSRPGIRRYTACRLRGWTGVTDGT